MRLLVTGGAGYVGSVVTAQLLAAGHQVTILAEAPGRPCKRVPHK
jgi:UDP-glucose 4-epimerase